MAYEDLLPTVEELAESLSKENVPPETIALVFERVGDLLDEHAQYHEYEFDRVGEKESRGANDALQEMADHFRSSGRYATAHYGSE